ncbi:hypothetical protein [Providencia hangzhouensis]
MEFKGSKIPWHIGSPSFKYKDTQIIRCANESAVAHLSYSREKCIAEANAHLIAAAPELLEALIEMQRNGHKQGWNDSYESSMEKTRLAIAKALGQQ